MYNWSVAQALATIALIAVGLGGMRAATPAMAQAATYVTYCVLVAATLGAALRGRSSSTWRAFVVLAWAYYLPVFALGSRELVAQLPTTTAFSAYIMRVRPTPMPPNGFSISVQENAIISFVRQRRIEPPVAFMDDIHSFNRNVQASMTIGHLLVTLLLGLLGILIGPSLSKGSRTHRQAE